MFLRDRRLALLPLLALAVLTAACGGSGDGGGTAAAETTPVAATDGSCDVEAAELAVGTREHTDLRNLAADLEGSPAAVRAPRPCLQEADADLVADAQLKGLGDSIRALTESVSQVPAVVADR
ncbi:MAG: efeO [Blastococcus sp.]|jgi:hypothetical protein|nr:efeO [Blastococcus sp.]